MSNARRVTSTIYTGLNPQPVDRLAASMFFKTPWWAEVPFPVQKAVIESRLPEEKLNVDFFRAPPAMKRTTPLVDMRGWTWEINGCHLVVTGYADARRHIHAPKKKDRIAPPTWWVQGVGNDWDPSKRHRYTVTHYWWSMYTSVSEEEFHYSLGDFTRVQGAIIRKGLQK